MGGVGRHRWERTFSVPLPEPTASSYHRFTVPLTGTLSLSFMDKVLSYEEEECSLMEETVVSRHP